MKFSVWPGPAQAWKDVLSGARHAEQTGWDGVWFADHFMPNTDDAEGDTLECWSVVAALAALVPRVRLGTLVCGNTYRHPAVLANQAAAVDVISGGRLILGLGAGWQQNEHAKYGIDFHTTRERLERLGEAVQVVKALTTQPRASFDGRYYTLDDAPLEPRPVQDPLPVLVGGGGEKVTLRIVAEHADEWNVWGTPATLRHKIEVLERHCEDVGRDPASIRRTANAMLFLGDDQAEIDQLRQHMEGRPAVIGTPGQVAETVAEYAAAGVDEFIIPDFNFATSAERQEAYDRFMEEVAPAVR